MGGWMSAGLSFSGGEGDNMSMIPFSPSSSSFFFFFHDSPRQPRSLGASMALLHTEGAHHSWWFLSRPHIPGWCMHGLRMCLCQAPIRRALQESKCTCSLEHEFFNVTFSSLCPISPFPLPLLFSKVRMLVKILCSYWTHI